MNNHLFAVRDAEEADLSGLASIRPPEVAHRGRLRDAKHAGFRYFVLLLDQKIIGFVCLVFNRPATWSDPDDLQHLPQIVDLYITETQRSQGYGTEAIRFMENTTADAGYNQLYIAVGSQDNPRAYTLYQRLGYQQLQSESSLHHWHSTDGDGEIHYGQAWLILMVKSLID